LKILDKINSPEDLKGLSPQQLETLAAELREELVSMVEANGGHLASTPPVRRPIRVH
jgi:1-deoxy-D-xylulose-5-phosphate synthase